MYRALAYYILLSVYPILPLPVISCLRNYHKKLLISFCTSVTNFKLFYLYCSRCIHFAGKPCRNNSIVRQKRTLHHTILHSAVTAPLPRCGASCVEALASVLRLYLVVLREFPLSWMGATAARCVPDRRVRPAQRGICVTARKACSATTAPASLEVQGSVSVSMQASSTQLYYRNI